MFLLHLELLEQVLVKHFYLLSKFVSILTNAIVVDISFSPVDIFIKSKISFDGALIGFEYVDLSGKKTS